MKLTLCRLKMKPRTYITALLMLPEFMTGDRERNSRSLLSNGSFTGTQGSFLPIILCPYIRQTGGAHLHLTKHTACHKGKQEKRSQGVEWWRGWKRFSFLSSVMCLSSPCAPAGHSWEPADTRPHPATPAEGATGSQPYRIENCQAGQRWGAVSVHEARPPHLHASDLPLAPVNAAGDTPRTRCPAGQPAAGYLSPPPTVPQ